MVTQQQMLDALKQIGLNLYERKLWVALLSRGTSTAGELSSLAKVPHSRTYDVLESLADKGFVMIQNAKPLRYVALPPLEALDRAKKKIKEDSELQVDRISDLQGSPVLKELEKTHKIGVKLIEPGEFTGSLKGRVAFHNQLETLLKGAKSRVSLLTTAQGLQELQSNHGDLLKKISSRGVKVRIAVPNSKDVSQTASALKSLGIEVRKLNKTDAAGRVAIIDGNHVVMSLTDDEEVHPSQDLALWTQSEHVAGDVMGPMFDALWQKAEPA